MPGGTAGGSVTAQSATLAATPVTASAAAPQAAVSAAPVSGTKFILVVEDDPILKNLLGHTFAGKYQTLYAAGGDEALTLFETYKPTVVLLDLMFPGTIDGFGVLERIRGRQDEAAKTPVIIVSNLGQESDKQRALQMGANLYLVKADVDVDEIVAKIEGVIQGGVPAA